MYHIMYIFGLRFDDTYIYIYIYIDSAVEKLGAMLARHIPVGLCHFWGTLLSDIVSTKQSEEGGSPKCFPYKQLKIIEKSKIIGNKKPRSDLYFTMFFVFLRKVKMILWSIHTFWYKGLAINEGK